MARPLPHSTAAMVRQQFGVATLCFVTLTLSSVPVREIEAQRPLSNHTTYNTIPTGQHNYKLRNGRTHDFIVPPTTVASIPRGILGGGLPIYEDLESTLLPPLGGRRDNRRRINYQVLANMHRGSSSGRGMESLRKELMKPSVGGPGGGISGNSPGYPSYAATSSIGKIDGLGRVQPAQRYGDNLHQAAGVLYSTSMPPQGSMDGKFMRYSTKINSLNELRRMNKNQADQPMRGIDDDIIMEEHPDPMQVIKDQLMSSQPQPMVHPESYQNSDIEDLLGVRCTFETPCAWKWTDNLPDGFHIMSGTEVSIKNMTGLYPGPLADNSDDANGHFLYARLAPTTIQINLTSPQFSSTMEKCVLELYMHQSGMSHGLSRVVVMPLHSQENSWVPAEIVGDNYRTWDKKSFRLGRISRDFRLVFEIVPKLLEGQKAHVAIDNLRMVNCFPEGTKSEKCSTSQVKCMNNKVSVCIPLPRICDITRDCDNAEDELLNCEKIPFGARCDFENDWCGWRDSGRTILSWSRHTGSSPTLDTGPEGDHTYHHLTNGSGGYYMLVNMNQHSNNSEKYQQIGFASNAIMISRTFNPPPSVHGDPHSPYRNSCVVRFYIHQFGKNPGSINLSVVEMKEKENITTTLWWSTKNQGEDWMRAEYILPNITSRYYLQFEARMGMRIYSDVAVDDFSLSPECFGINIPPEHLNGYNYWNVRHTKSPTHKDFENHNYLELGTCDNRGMHGPTQSQCETYYASHNRTNVLEEVKVTDEIPYKGMQKWRVPHEGFYTFIVKGASGGLGSTGVGSSRGAVAVAVLELHKNEELYLLVGQQGENACSKSMGAKDDNCNFSSSAVVNGNNGAGGGGGGSYVFLLNSARNEAVPLVVAGGGGGLGVGRYLDEAFQHGQKENSGRRGLTGQLHGEQLSKETAGPGGGWRANADQALDARYGAALLLGGRGGFSCYVDMETNGSVTKRYGQGGFGGGGGGCDTGGGGGGFAGGDVYLNESNGEGGSSYISASRTLKELSSIYEGANFGAGSIIIIPAIEGCGCDYRCLALDEYRSSVKCICPEGWRIRKDNTSACDMPVTDTIPLKYLISFFTVLMMLLIASLAALVVMLYNRYQRKKLAKERHKMLREQDMQLTRLRHNIDENNLNNFNPNYGCDDLINGQINVNSLPQVARESLRLVKALGQGAFGEVYQGLYRHRDGDAVEMPVAVKTLPEMSTRQAEEDFLMEAAIMAKFNHPNMVHLIGVCFDRHPRFIVLELLAGGDLKNFLREGRHKPERPSPLTMKDLVFCALDVAKGCRYMESQRFIHRDIAARNCLLSSKGPGRVVKIADFGMARDIYRSDYYRKGGKAMLPIKWMPPEAFLDGIFTSKTDVWSFGVLLWEVFSLGLMPYTGLPNPEVMQLVTNGGRLGTPPGCPPVIYKIMADCWNPTPEDRPTFSSLLERLKAVTEDPAVMNAPLPHILRPPSNERDQTIIRPQGVDDVCLQVPTTSDYLIPLPGITHLHQQQHQQLQQQHQQQQQMNDMIDPSLPPMAISTGTNICTPPGVSSPSAPTAQHTQLLKEDEHTHNATNEGCWETSFILPNSKSDQPLLNNNNNSSGSQKSINTASIGAQGPGNTSGYSSSSQRSPVSNGLRTIQSSSTTAMPVHDDDEEETKLISLDTPQPTPTTIQPPLSFSSQLDGITLDPAALTKSLNTNVTVPNATTAATVAAAAAAAAAATNTNLNNKHSSYANIQMMSSSVNNLKGTADTPSEKLNGSLLHSGSNGLTKMNGNLATNGGTNAPPFTIQGYAERYKDKHSEISC
ncbi:anaplastic lymphoma kinase isoform X3 [Musca autumnalis]|uniref:anaplastic lymphoma kinase isoform X3 n=1 Tax=Musca autumnalis TaxID=221902 RepID=UPI003CEE125B